MLKKILQNSNKTHKYLSSLPNIYIVGCWASYGVRCHSLAKWVKDENGNMIPYVYDYDDHNGTADQFELRSIYHTTTGQILFWTMNKNVADRVAEALNQMNEKRGIIQ